MAGPRAPLSEPTVWAEGPPASSPPGLPSSLEEIAAGFPAARSKQVSRQRLLPREQATASAHLSIEEPGVTSSVAPLRLHLGFDVPGSDHRLGSFRNDFLSLSGFE